MYDVNFSHMILFCRPLEECDGKGFSSVLNTPGIDNRRILHINPGKIMDLVVKRGYPNWTTAEHSISAA